MLIALSPCTGGGHVCLPRSVCEGADQWWFVQKLGGQPCGALSVAVGFEPHVRFHRGLFVFKDTAIVGQPRQSLVGIHQPGCL